MLRFWKCEGMAKDGRWSASGKHDPFENFGEKCAVCALPREEVVRSSPSSGKGVVIASTIGVLAALGLGSWLFLKPNELCPTGQQNVNGACRSSNPALSPTISPASPSGSSNPSIAPAPVSIAYQTLAEVPNVPGMIVRYGGSTSMAVLRSPEVVSRILQAHPTFQLQYKEPPPGEKPGSGSGIRMLIDDEISVALSSRSIKDEEFARAKTRGFSLEPVPVAIDGIAIYVNSQVSLPRLTVSQLKDIYTGKITNWNQVGGPNQEIQAFSRNPNDGGTPEYFKEHVMEKGDFPSSIAQRYVRDQTDSIRKVAGTSGGIGYGTAAEVCNQDTIKPLPLLNSQNQPISPCEGQQANLTVFADNTYPITRQLFVIIKRNSRDAEVAGVAYANMLLSSEGQQIVKDAGLVPIRK